MNTTTATPPRPASVAAIGTAGIAGPALYAITLLVQLISVYVRYLLFGWIAARLLPYVVGRPEDGLAHVLALAAGLGPLVWSLAAFEGARGTGAYWRTRAGGREPSERERLAYADALGLLIDLNPGLRTPKEWFVIDEVSPNAAVYGETLMISRGLIFSEALPAVLAHELGHLNSIDGRLTVAIYRLAVAPRLIGTAPPDAGLLRRIFGAIYGVASGALGLYLMRLPWATHFRAREYVADAYAAKLGMGELLAAYLEVLALPFDRPVPYAWLSDDSHPPTELRIDRLDVIAAQTGSVHVATESAAVKVAASRPPAAGPDGPLLTAPDPSAI